MSVEGSGFGSSEPVSIMFDGRQVASAATDELGRFTTDFRVPRSALPGRHSVTALGEVSGLRAKSAFVVNTDWLGFQFDGKNNRANPYENVLGSSNVFGLTTHWTLSTGSAIYSSPVVARGVVYVGNWDLYAIDASTGLTNWVFSADGNIDTGIAVAGNRVYVSANDFYSEYNTVHALDADGQELWTFMAKNAFTSPTVAGGVVYVSSGNHVHALDALTGTKLWSFRTGSGGEHAAPAVADGVVYASGDNTLYAIDAATGTELWSVPLAGGNSAPVVSNGVVYSGAHVGGYDGTINARDTTTGAEIWTFTAIDTGGMNSPAVDDGTVYTTSVGGIHTHYGRVFALDAASGAKLWESAVEDRMAASPAVANGVVYVRSDAAVYALDAVTGTRLWRFVTSSAVEESSPAVANGVLYFGSTDNSIYAFGLS